MRIKLERVTRGVAIVRSLVSARGGLARQRRSCRGGFPDRRRKHCLFLCIRRRFSLKHKRSGFAIRSFGCDVAQKAALQYKTPRAQPCTVVLTFVLGSTYVEAKAILPTY